MNRPSDVEIREALEVMTLIERGFPPWPGPPTGDRAIVWGQISALAWVLGDAHSGYAFGQRFADTLATHRRVIFGERR